MQNKIPQKKLGQNKYKSVQVDRNFRGDLNLDEPVPRNFRGDLNLDEPVHEQSRNPSTREPAKSKFTILN